METENLTRADNSNPKVGTALRRRPFFGLGQGWRRHAPWLGLLLLLLVTALLLPPALRVRVTDEAGVKAALPEQMGAWRGEDLLYCQSETCARSYRVTLLTNTSVCAKCGSPLGALSPGERNLLPPDTVVVRKLYRNPRGETVLASIVLSGRDQKSIHRPQQCLAGQGYVIERERELAVPLAGRDPLAVKTLILRQRGGGAQNQPPWLFAYWFVGKGRETPSHYQRVAWMAWDNLAYGVRHRWAYIALLAQNTDAGPDENAALRDFIRQLHPLITP